MIKVENHGTNYGEKYHLIAVRHECLFCNCVFTYERSDIKPRGSWQYTIRCPECNAYHVCSSWEMEEYHTKKLFGGIYEGESY